MSYTTPPGYFGRDQNEMSVLGSSDLQTKEKHMRNSDKAGARNLNHLAVSRDNNFQPTRFLSPYAPSFTILTLNINPTSHRTSTTQTVFAQPHITQIRDLINSIAPLASWSPLKSFRRIVCSFISTDDATAVRQALDGETINGDRVRVYFGEHTPLQPVDQHLQAPEAKKLFFISPPPSPPHGWESKNEGLQMPWKSGADDFDNTTAEASNIGRPRSASSVLLFEPEDDSKEDMPAISVDDYTDSGDERSPIEPVMEKANIHTTRPPVELMHDA
ncbi:Calcipressin-domain-containing protein [Trichophaea hybrida]|nr:Calcipressin-domain-containing protein [Trichophaea hybrida]